LMRQFSIFRLRRGASNLPINRNQFLDPLVPPAKRGPVTGGRDLHSRDAFVMLN
jgi:hypothetical protein